MFLNFLYINLFIHSVSQSTFYQVSHFVNIYITDCAPDISDVKKNSLVLIWWELETRKPMIIMQLTIAMTEDGSILRERGGCLSMTYQEGRKNFSKNVCTYL